MTMKDILLIVAMTIGLCAWWIGREEFRDAMKNAMWAGEEKYSRGWQVLSWAGLLLAVAAFVGAALL